VHKQYQTQIQVLRLLSDIARDNSKDILVILRRIGSNQDQAIQSFYHQKFGMNEDQTGMDADDFEMDAPTITVTDEKGQTLTCYVEHSLKLEDREYVLLLPVDSPIEIFAWEESDEDDEESAVPISDDLIEVLFPLAKAVLEEQNLTLKRTAVTLTVEGDLPEPDEETGVDLVEDDEDEEEELQLLASFYHHEQEYAIYTPLDPFLILARLDEDGVPHLLSPEEMQKLEPLLPMLEDQLFDELD
jgi:hypothetical protein